MQIFQNYEILTNWFDSLIYEREIFKENVRAVVFIRACSMLEGVKLPTKPTNLWFILQILFTNFKNNSTVTYKFILVMFKWHPYALLLWKYENSLKVQEYESNKDQSTNMQYTQLWVIKTAEKVIFILTTSTTSIQYQWRAFMTFNFYSRLKKLHIKGESRDKDPALIRYNSIIALNTQALHP